MEQRQETGFDIAFGKRSLLGKKPMGETMACIVCGYVLTLDYFTKTMIERPASTRAVCFVCRDEARLARAWTNREYERVRQAARQTLDLWPRMIDMLAEEDRVKLRELLCSLERIPNMEAN